MKHGAAGPRRPNGIPALVSVFFDTLWTSRLLPRGITRELERARQSAWARRFVHGAFWSIVGGLGSRAFVLLGSIILARIMGRDTYGELGIIQSTVGMFGTLAGFGLGVTATKHVAELRAKEPLRAARIVALSTRFSMVASGLAATLLALAAPWLAASSLGAPWLAAPLRASALLLFLSGVSGAQLGALAGLHAFRQIAKVNVGYAAVTVPMSVVGALYLGLGGVVWSLSGGMLVACVFGRLALREACSEAHLPMNVSGWSQERAILWRFSLPAALSGALVGSVTWACATILVNQNRGYAEMGVFSAANQWFIGLTILPALVGQAVLPLMAEQVAGESRGGALQAMRRMMWLNGGALVPTLALCVASPLIMSSYGPDFEGRWLTLVLCLLTAAVVAVQMPVGQFIAASGRMWMGLVMNTGWGLTFLILTLILSPRLGADGVAAARLLAYATHTVWTVGYAVHLLRATR